MRLSIPLPHTAIDEGGREIAPSRVRAIKGGESFPEELAEAAAPWQEKSLPVGEGRELPPFGKHLEGCGEDLFSQRGREGGPRQPAEDRINFFDATLATEFGDAGDTVFDHLDARATAAGDRGEGGITFDRKKARVAL